MERDPPTRVGMPVLLLLILCALFLIRIAHFEMKFACLCRMRRIWLRNFFEENNVGWSWNGSCTSMFQSQMSNGSKELLTFTLARFNLLMYKKNRNRSTRAE